MEITGGKTYAELDREDPNRDTAMTSSFLQASLFTSVVAFGVAAMAMAIGIAFVLFGLALREPQPAAARAHGLGTASMVEPPWGFEPQTYALRVSFSLRKRRVSASGTRAPSSLFRLVRPVLIEHCRSAR